jgi:hypothetical protein
VVNTKGIPRGETVSKVLDEIINVLKFAAGALTIVVIVMVTLAISAHCTVSQRENSFGAIIVDSNPNSYMYGAIVSGSIIGDDEDHAFTNLRFNPAHTPMLYDETILLCGDQSDKLYSGPIVLTYKSVSHRMYKGIACHDLVSVDQVASKETL